MNKVASDIAQAFLDGYRACLADLEESMWDATWWDNHDESVVWDLIQALKR